MTPVRFSGPRSGPPCKDRSTLYEEIASKIIAELEAGRLPWVQPWGSSGVRAPLGLPNNAATGRAYSGINVLILWAAVVEHGFSTQTWLTFKQALALGGHVRGERGTTVPLCRPLHPRRRARPRPREGRGATRDPIPQALHRVQRRTVRGTARTDAALPPPVDTNLILPQVQQLIRATGADIRIGGDRAYYDMAGDFIRVPPPQAFFEPINWHRSALHRARASFGRGAPVQPGSVQFLGREHRLRGDNLRDDYSLHLCRARHRAHGAACRLHRRLGRILGEPERIVRAASAASKAADYLLAFRDRAAAAARHRKDAGTESRA